MSLDRVRSNVVETEFCTTRYKTSTADGSMVGPPTEYTIRYDEGGIISDSKSPIHFLKWINRSGDYGTNCSIVKRSVDMSAWNILPYQSVSEGAPSKYWSWWEGTRVPTLYFSKNQFTDDPNPNDLPSDLQMKGWGTKGVNLAYPAKPMLSLAQSLAELKREGFPSFPVYNLVKTGSRRDIGGEYLNYQFGIRPLVQDVKDILTYDSDLVDRLEKIRRDTSRKYRRRATIDTQREYRELDKTSLSPRMPTLFGSTGYASRSSDVRVYELETSNVWFSGEFQFHIPALYRELPQVDHLREIMFKSGTEITPELLWELAPWSWLIDWQFSVGDAISNLSRFALDGAVMRYGYVMYRKVVERTYVHSNWGTMHVTSVTFRRTRANPFGFGTTFGELNPRQWAILTALGLSRGRSIQLDTA